MTLLKLEDNHCPYRDCSYLVARGMHGILPGADASSSIEKCEAAPSLRLFYTRLVHEQARSGVMDAPFQGVCT